MYYSSLPNRKPVSDIYFLFFSHSSDGNDGGGSAGDDDDFSVVAANNDNYYNDDDCDVRARPSQIHDNQMQLNDVKP